MCFTVMVLVVFLQLQKEIHSKRSGLHTSAEKYLGLVKHNELLTLNLRVEKINNMCYDFNVAHVLIAVI